MRYVSTRGGSPSLGFSDAVAAGLAPDGGLFVPESLPDLSGELAGMAALAYPELCTRFLSAFATDIPAAELAQIVRLSYSTFDVPEVAPLRALSKNLHVLELFHGPTLAFKDVALQLLGNLYGRQCRIRRENINVLGATSGDTGAAAIHGLMGKPGVAIFTYNHEVTSLPAPAAFRVLVRARWLDRHRHAIRHEDIYSTACVQPLLQPDLAIGEPLARAAGPSAGTAVYSVVVRNDGTAAATNFDVGLTVNGVARPNIAVPTLAANSTQLVDFTAPRCNAGTTIVATADVAGVVTEPANTSRSRTFACGR